MLYEVRISYTRNGVLDSVRYEYIIAMDVANAVEDAKKIFWSRATDGQEIEILSTRATEKNY